MISGVNYSQYYKVASMSQSLNNFIRQAMVAKAEISSPLNYSINFSKEIGANVDIFA